MRQIRVATPRDIPDYLADLVVDGTPRAGVSRWLIFAALSRAADRGDPCPTCDMLAEICGFESVSTTSWHVRELERLGYIRVRRFARTREVEVIDTGKRTAPSADQRPHWRERSIQPSGAGA